MYLKKLLVLIFLSIPIISIGQSSLKDSTNYDENFIKKNIIGEWKDQNSTLIFKKKGLYSVLFDNGDMEHGKWYVSKNVLTLKGESVLTFSAYKIIFMSSLRFEYQSVFIQEDNTIWIAHKKIKTRK